MDVFGCAFVRGKMKVKEIGLGIESVKTLVQRLKGLISSIRDSIEVYIYIYSLHAYSTVAIKFRTSNVNYQ